LAQFSHALLKLHAKALLRFLRLAHVPRDCFMRGLSDLDQLVLQVSRNVISVRLAWAIPKNIRQGLC